MQKCENMPCDPGEHFTPKKMHILPKPKSVLVVSLSRLFHINITNIRSKNKNIKDITPIFITLIRPSQIINGISVPDYNPPGVNTIFVHFCMHVHAEKNSGPNSKTRP